MEFEWHVINRYGSAVHIAVSPGASARYDNCWIAFSDKWEEPIFFWEGGRAGDDGFKYPMGLTDEEKRRWCEAQYHLNEP
jgi:hypothetical protein